MTAEPTVFVVDDVASVRRSLQSLLESAGFRAQTYPSASKFLEAYRPDQPGCLVLDLRLGTESGLDLQEELRRRQATLPVIFITAHGSVPASVRAFRAGAMDFLEKPIRPSTLLARVREALESDRRARDVAGEHASVARLLSRLTPREQEVATRMARGESSKEIAAALGVSPRTVEGHRRVVLRKMELSSAAALAGLLSRTGA
jgi:two-component system, LuxR family, response regulator FixJ